MKSCPSIFTIFGLTLDFVGVLLLLAYAKKSMGATTPTDEQYTKSSPWLYVGLTLTAIGFLAQVIGSILAIL
jgi:hypothetical protein